jgi:hypothetical protein
MSLTMQLVETPVQMITGSIRLFVFACFLDDAVKRGAITASCLQEQMTLYEGTGWGITLKKPHTADELKHGTQNLMLTTLGTTALATSKALELVYEGRPDPEDTTQFGSARVLIYQIRCAFAHDPLNPVWAPTNSYARDYQLTVSVNRPVGELETERVIAFNPHAFMAASLNPEQFGGLGGYLGLLTYFQRTLENHPKGKQRNHYSPALP